jgi:hypothetical protein
MYYFYSNFSQKYCSFSDNNASLLTIFAVLEELNIDYSTLKDKKKILISNPSQLNDIRKKFRGLLLQNFPKRYISKGVIFDFKEIEVESLKIILNIRNNVDNLIYIFYCLIEIIKNCIEMNDQLKIEYVSKNDLVPEDILKKM